MTTPGALALGGAIRTLEESRNNALRYSAHLSALLKEACDILEKLEVTVEVSDPLKCWWEKEKRKREAHECALVSSTGTPIGSRVGLGRGLVQHKSFADQATDKQSEAQPKVELACPPSEK